MDEPDKSSGQVSPAMVFTAVGADDAVKAADLKESKKSIGLRLKMRKSTPRPIMKGPGRKRHPLSPSPKLRQNFKRSSREVEGEERGREFTNKRNLLAALDEAASNVDPQAEKPPSGLADGETKPEEERGIFDFTMEGKSVPTMDESPSPVVDRMEAGPVVPADETPQPDEERYVGIDGTEHGPPSVDGLNPLVQQGFSDGCTVTKSLLGKCNLSPQKGQLHHTATENKLSVVVNKDTYSSSPPKNVDLLRLANLDSADILDNLQTQPLQHPPHTLVSPAPPPHLQVQPPLLLGSTSPQTWPSPSQANGASNPMAIDVHFPPLGKGRILSIRDTFKPSASHKTTTYPSTNNFPILPHASVNGNIPPQDSIPDNHGQPEPPKEKAITAPPQSHVEVVKRNTSTPGTTTLTSQGIEDIGSAGYSGNLPAIYFSLAETELLAKDLGHAIVGKFSHSLPSDFQIQRALNNIKFSRGFSWKYINAKHIIIQFDDHDDYARMLTGPKGTPIWFIDRHPMRVFKWTPEFDIYCESPIAAIWCNIIALPIHLYNTSALFAIGKLFGTPIKIDPATANRTRYSFARLCIEIDITSPPPDEFVLDICGRETTLKVKWDKIPLYCVDCQHVGHSKEKCRAFGRNGNQEQRDHNTSHTATDNPAKTNTPEAMPSSEKSAVKEWAPKQSSGPSGSGNGVNRDLDGKKGSTKQRDDLSDILGPEGISNSTFVETSSHGRWQTVTGRGGSSARGHRGRGTQGRAGPGRGYYARSGSLSPTRSGEGHHKGGSTTNEHSSHANTMSSNRYYKLMENGEFDVDTYEDGGNSGPSNDEWKVTTTHQPAIDPAVHHATNGNTQMTVHGEGIPNPSGMDTTF